MKIKAVFQLLIKVVINVGNQSTMQISIDMHMLSTRNQKVYPVSIWSRIL